MDSKKINLIWGISIFVIGIITMILVGINLVETELTDIVVRICGVIDLVSLPVFVFLTVKKAKSRE